MSQSEWKEEIFQVIEKAQREIQEINTELNTYPKDSPRYTQLYETLLEKLKEYDQLPCRDEIQERKEARLEEIKGLCLFGDLPVDEELALMDEECRLLDETLKAEEIEGAVVTASLNETLSNIAASLQKKQGHLQEEAAGEPDRKYRAALQELEQTLECRPISGDMFSGGGKNQLATWLLVPILALSLCAAVFLLSAFY